jgi:hypothetical protein
VCRSIRPSLRSTSICAAARGELAASSQTAAAAELRAPSDRLAAPTGAPATRSVTGLSPIVGDERSGGDRCRSDNEGSVPHRTDSLTSRQGRSHHQPAHPDGRGWTAVRLVPGRAAFAVDPSQAHAILAGWDAGFDADKAARATLLGVPR